MKKSRYMNHARKGAGEEAVAYQPAPMNSSIRKLPFLHILVIVSTAIACFGGEAIMGYNISGLSWFIPLVISVLLLANRIAKIRFPIFLWVPWIILVLIYLLVSEFPSLQRSVQLLCPLAIGMVASTYRMREDELQVFLKLIDYLGVMLIGIVLLKTGMLFTGQLPEITGLAPEVMTGIIISALFAVRYVGGEKKYLIRWGIMTAIPIIALTRTAIVVSGLTLPLTLGPLKLWKRILILFATAIIGITLFYSPRIQSKMFFSGSGSISDIMSEDFRSTGRYYMWEYFRGEIRAAPWFGHGVGAGEVYTREITKGYIAYPHNDWLLSMYDYGVLGTTIYICTMFGAILHAYRRSKASAGLTRILFHSGASIFFFYAMMMYTDNIMIYASFFGNLHFAILGAAYGAISQHQPQQQMPHKRRRITW